MLNHPVGISSGYNHSCALTNDGVKCWGSDKYGQTKVPVLNNPIQISSGGNYTCALADDGVKCWGDNSDGETTVPFLPNPVQLATGDWHACAITDDGVKCWGNNWYEQMNVPSLNKPTKIVAGSQHTCAITADGLRCWGLNAASIVPSIQSPWVDVTVAEAQKPDSCDNNSDNCSFHDNISHLDWSKAAIEKLKWSEAQNYCKMLNLNHHRDWRLPSASELLEGVSHGISNIDAPNFVGTFDKDFWSNLESLRFSEAETVVNLESGFFSDVFWSDVGLAICVRGR